MSKYFKHFTLAIILAALCVFFVTGSVFADDETPAEAPPLEELIPEGETPIALPVDESPPTEELVVEEPPLAEQPLEKVPLAEQPVVEDPLLEELPLEEVTAEEPADGIPAEEMSLDEVIEEPAPETPVEEAAAEVPLTLVDGEGEPLVVGDEETAKLLTSGDPYFLAGTMQYTWVYNSVGCASVTPLPGYTLICDDSVASGGDIFTPVLDAIKAGTVPNDKKIYVTSGDYWGTVNIDGVSNPTTLGVLNGLIGLDGSQNTTLYGDVYVIGVKAGFTLSGFTINGGVAFAGNKGTVTLSDLDVENSTGDGIAINNQAGAVVMTDVESSNNGSNGAFIFNDTGVYPVTITNAEFDDNVNGGLFVTSKGSVTLNGVSASRNHNLSGTVIETNGVVKVMNSTFVENADTGLIIEVPTSAAITLENVQGAHNAGAGIHIGVSGAVTERNVIAFWNDAEGMYITKPDGGTFYPSAVSIYDSSFPVNGTDGLYVESKGNVQLSGVYNTSGNQGYGAVIDTCLAGIGSTCSGTGTVTLVNPGLSLSEFNWNSATGLLISSAGAVTLTGVAASNNGSIGVYIRNNYPGKTGGVTINSLPFVPSATAQNRFSDNGWIGISIESNGVVAVNGNPEWTLRVDGNGDTGICIACNGGAYLPAAVTLKGIDLENNGNDGVKVNSKGAITLNGVWVNNNWGTHMWTPGNGIVLYNFHGSGAVTLTDVGVNYTGSYSIEINSKGAVTLTRVNTFRTGLQGIYINNKDGVGAVTLTDVDVQQPHDTGILIWSKGNVTLSGVNAEDVGGKNFNTPPIRYQGTISNQTWFKFNATAGDDITITMTLDGYEEGGQLELFNASTGERIEFYDGDSSGGSFEISYTDLPDTGNYFIVFSAWMDDQTIYDYEMTAKYTGTDDPGASMLYAHNAIVIDNTYGKGNVSITGSSNNPNPWVSDNTGSGILVDSTGTITVRDVNLHRNGGGAVDLDNAGATTAKTVTVSNLDIYNSGGDGLTINSIGAVSMTNIQSNRNGGYGIFVDNCGFDSGVHKCRGTGAISLLATSGNENRISENRDTALYFDTIGLVTLNNLNIDSNGYGLFITAPYLSMLAAIPTSGGVTLTTVGDYYNRVANTYAGSSIDIFTYGAVSLTRLEVSNNEGNGIYIENDDAASPKAVTMTHVDVYNNSGDGIEIRSKGAVTLNGTASSNNVQHRQYGELGATTEGINIGGWGFEFEVSGTPDLAVEFGSDMFRGDLTLYDADGNEVFTSPAVENRGGDTSFLIENLIDGTYYLQVNAWEGHPYRYNLSIYDCALDGSMNCTGSPAATSLWFTNKYNGAEIYTLGDVTIARVSDEYRWWYNENTYRGIMIETSGAIKISDIDTSGNYDYGIQATSTRVGKTATLTNLEVHDNGFPNSIAAVSLYTRGPVTMTNLSVTDNRGTGVYLDNCAWDGTKCRGTGAVTLNATAGRENYIANNDGAGLYITSVGLVMLSNFTVENHPYDNITVSPPWYSTGTTPFPVGGVTITSTGGYWNNSRNSWEGSGISIRTYGPVSLTRLNVNDNYNYGIWIDNANAAGLQPVTLTDVEVWHSQNTGISINSRGNVTLNGVSSSQNLEYDNLLDLGDGVGESADRQYGIGNIYFHFDANDLEDIDIRFFSHEFEGNMRLYYPWGEMAFEAQTDYAGETLSFVWDVYLAQSGTYTLELAPWNDRPYYYYMETLGGSGTTTWDYSAVSGIVVNNTNGSGNVTVAKSAARPQTSVYGNSGDGLQLNTNGTLTISDFTSHYNGGTGLQAWIGGVGKAATLTRVEVNDPGSDGISLTTLGAVTLTDVDIRRARTYGLYVNGAGNITLTRVESVFNDGYGAYLRNTNSSSTAAVTITDSYFGYNEYGLNVRANGAVKLLGVGADNNFLQNASIWDGYLSGGAVINGYLPGIDRDEEDRYIRDTRFNINVTVGMASSGYDLDMTLLPYGTGMRVMLYNTDGTLLEFGSTTSGGYYAWEGESWDLYYENLPQGNYYLLVRAITWFESSHYWGDPGTYELVSNPFEPASDPVFSLADSYGADVETNGAVTVDKGLRHTSSWFNNNDGTGLDIAIYSPGGNVIVARSDLYGNMWTGLNLYNDGLGNTLTLTNVYLGENGDYNAYLHTGGAVSWTGGESSNSGYGVYIDNTVSNVYPVTISKVDFHNAWDRHGLDIRSYGNVSLTSVGAWENAWDGITINNCMYDYGIGGCKGSGTVAVNNNNGSYIGNNGDDGLYVSSGRNVTLTNIEASQNGASGINVNNSEGNATGTVTLTYTLDRNVTNNGEYGIYVISNDAIKLTSSKKLWVNNNGENSSSAGIYLRNTVNAPVTVSGSLVTSINSGWNNGNGLTIHSKGAVTVKNTNVYWNQDNGIYISNDFGGGIWPTSVTLTAVVAQGNGERGWGYGVEVLSNGPVTVFALDSRENRSDGLYVYTDTASIVTVKKSVFRNNGDGSTYYGLRVDTAGNVLLDSINVASNDRGVHVRAGGTATMLGTYFKNEILGHWSGMAIDLRAGGNVSLTKLDIKDSGDSKIESSAGSVTLNTVNVLNNTGGLRVYAANNASLTKVVAMNNGDAGNDADGIYVELKSGNVTFTDCASTGNYGSGIEVYYNYVPGTPLPKPILIRTTYFGNDADGDGNPNLYYYY